MMSYPSRIKTVSLCIALSFSTGLKAETAATEIEVLKQQIQILQQRYLEQNAALHNMAIKIQQLEGQTQANTYSASCSIRSAT